MKINSLLLSFAIFSIFTLFGAGSQLQMQLLVHRQENAPIYDVLAKNEVENEAKIYAEHLDLLNSIWSPEQMEEFKNDETAKILFERPTEEQRFADISKEYKGLETGVELLRNKSGLSDKWNANIWGGIDYSMTLNEMEQVVIDKFEGLKRNGKIISEQEFWKIKDDYFGPRTDLERIWGAEYLKKKINQSEELKSKYDVPNYVIVANYPGPIEVELSFWDDRWPIVSRIKNGSIFFKKITGKPAAFGVKQGKYPYTALISEIYDDFSADGNIIEDDKTGQLYIVDTDFKSINMKVQLNDIVKRLLNYAHQRFLYFNNKMYQFTFALSEDLR